MVKWVVAIVTMLLSLSFLAGRAVWPSPEGPLSRAARTGELATVRALLASGVGANTPDGPRGSRPLANAARTGQIETMRALLDAGADPNLTDAGGNRWLPLMHALHKRRMSSVRFLLDHGATADGPVGLKLTPLMMAAATGQLDAVRLLLDRGADPRRPLPEGGSILDLALSGGALTDIEEPLLGACHAETVRLLIHRAPDLGVSTAWRGRLSVFFARLNGCQAALDLVNAPR
jgi:ankyrin repeat protein